MKRESLCRKMLVRCIAVALALSLLLAGAALCEVNRGNLAERFSNVPQVIYQGQTHYLRGRLTVALVTGFLPDAQDGKRRSDFAAVLVFDDDEKRITPIYIDGRTLVELEGETVALGDIFAQVEDPETGCLRMLEAVNGLLGDELIEDYMAIDLDGLTDIQEFSGLEGNTRERLHLLRLLLKSMPSKQLNQLYSAISAYLVTDMKSGAVMRALDKAERYEIADTVDLPVMQLQEGDALLPEADKILEAIVDVFYETELI